MLGNKKANLFIVGAAKAGTTTLFSHLGSHPEICICALKEPNYFSAEALKNDHLYYSEPIIDTLEKYEELFNPGSSQNIIAEASVSYLFYPGTAEKIYRYNPGAKIIIVLRNPSERAFSHYLMDKKLGLVNETFDEIITMPAIQRNRSQYFQQYINYGLYFEQVKAYLDTFSVNQVQVVLFESLKSDLNLVLNQVSRFIQMQNPLLPLQKLVFNESNLPGNKYIGAIYRQRNVRKFIKKISPQILLNRLEKVLFAKPAEHLTKEQHLWLINFYAEDLKELEQLTGFNLSGWYEK